MADAKCLYGCPLDPAALHPGTDALASHYAMVHGDGLTPFEVGLIGRIQLAKSLLGHRFDPSDPDVQMVLGVLDGASIESLIEV